MVDSVLLCIDVGGTKLDYSFVDHGSTNFNPRLSGRLLCSEFNSFDAALFKLLEQAPFRVDSLCVAAAGPVVNSEVVFTNLSWSIDCQKLKQKFGFKNVQLVNDLTAVVWSLNGLSMGQLITVKKGETCGNVSLVVAPGTGLGVGFGVHHNNNLTCLGSEGGHVSFSPRNEIERELLEFLAISNKHIDVESICSGLGLGQLFRFLTRENPCSDNLDYHALGPWLHHQVAQQLEYKDVALGVFELFFDLLAEVCGNLAVTCLPSRGIYLAGGLMEKLGGFLDEDRFIVRFLDRTVQSRLLANIPIYRLKHEKPALLGCYNLMSCYLD